MPRLDNGPEIIAAAPAERAATGTGILVIPPGKPRRNPVIKSCAGQLRDEWRTIHAFWSLTQA